MKLTGFVAAVSTVAASVSASPLERRMMGGVSHATSMPYGNNTMLITKTDRSSFAKESTQPEHALGIPTPLGDAISSRSRFSKTRQPLLPMAATLPATQALFAATRRAILQWAVSWDL